MDPNSQLVKQAAIAYAVSRGIEWLKCTQRFPWLTAHSAQANAWASRSIAILTGIGFTFALGQNSITLTWPTPEAGGEALWAMLESWAMQEMAYKTVIKDPNLKETQPVMKPLRGADVA